jgi:hypothetical protein
MKCPRLFLASAVLLFAALSAEAGTVSSPVPQDRGAGGLTFFSPSPGSVAEAVPPTRSTLFSDPLQAHRERSLAPMAPPPVLVKNPFSPAAQ